jgi:hypothetical protein
MPTLPPITGTLAAREAADRGGNRRPRQRKTSLTRAIVQAERSGKRVSSLTLPDGATLRFDESTKIESALDKWVAKHAREIERH